MRAIFQTSQFKKDIIRVKKRGKDLSKLKKVVSTIVNSRELEDHHRDHALCGKWTGSRDCHVEPNWILIYRVEAEVLFLERTGTHSDLFK
jgi:mRNA interferase YafQ